MPLTKLQFRPGINRETTPYTNEGGWFDADKVRFRFGFPEKIGGWSRKSNSSFLGTARAMHPFVALDGTKLIGIGTHLKYYVDRGGGYNDVTPLRLTTTAGGATFAAAKTTLASNVGVSDTTISLTSGAGFPSSGRIKINNEQITYASISSNTLLGCVRGLGGTTPAAHSSGDAVGCANIVVTVSNHGALVNDFVTLTAAVSLGGNITAAILNQEYQVATVESTGSFTIQARTVSTLVSITDNGVLNPTFVFPTASDTGTGGSLTVAAFQVNAGLDSSIVGTGWGSGPWGRGSWGSGSSSLAAGQTLRLWNHDNFGENLIINIRDGGIYYWEKGVSPDFSRAVALSALPGADPSTPTLARMVLVSNRDRHIIAFGCDPETAIGTQDPLLIRFSDQESPTVWSSLPTNTAGELRLSTGSKIVTAVETRQQMLVFTEVTVNAMQYLGPPFTFGLTQLSDNTTIASSMAAVSINDNVFWMGVEDFYIYTGQVTKLPCSVRSYVFGDFNLSQSEKVFAASNSSFSEVWWFYPSAASNEIDRYVVFNYQEKSWCFGRMARTAWIDRGIYDYPIAANVDGRLLFHEYGTDDGSANPPVAMPSYVESSDVSIGNGDRFTFLRRIIPDVTFDGSETASPSVEMTLEVRNFPGQTYQDTSTAAVSRSAVIPVEQFTQKVDLRLRGRSVALKVQSSGFGVQWRLGSPRIEVRPDGQR